MRKGILFFCVCVRVRVRVCVCCDKNKNKNEAGEESGSVGKKKGATAMAEEGEEIVASTKAKVRMNFGTPPLKMTIKKGSTKTRSLIQIPCFQVLSFRAARNLRSRIRKKRP